MKRLMLLLAAGTFCANIFSQGIECDNVQIKDAYDLALNTVKINVRRGILAAGADYGGEWTRDISINSWNCVSILLPSVAEKSLWSVTINRDTIGHQYWDKIIWAVSALNHYYVTGDVNFLRQAYACSGNTMRQLETKAFDNDYGLFKGPAVLADGIAGYPEPVYDRKNYSSFVLDHNNADAIKCLSTNCLYYGAYLSLIEMASILKADDGTINNYKIKADALKTSILKHFYNEKENVLYYLIDGNGTVHKYQEAMGYSFAVIFGVLDMEQAASMIQKASVSQYGITCLSPDFPRYSPAHPGRHNNIIWPMANGFFARACIMADEMDAFNRELRGLTALSLDQDKGNYEFREIYNPYTGKPDGGYQAAGKENPDYHWASCRFQTWSATAYINMVFYGVAGIRLNDKGMNFQPCLPDDIHYIKLTGILYRQSQISVEIIGSGKHIKTFLLNGEKQTDYYIPSDIKGDNEIVIEME
jgi:hypothetical protein